MIPKFQCQQCDSIKDVEVLSPNLSVCKNCGWIWSKSDFELKQATKFRYQMTAISLSAALTLTLFLTVIWGRHAVEISYLKTKEVIGIASKEDLYKKAQISIEVGYNEGAISTLENLCTLHPDELFAKEMLIDLYYKTKQYGKLVKTGADYFSKNGTQTETAYQFAKSLESQGHIDKAIEYFEFILNAKPDQFQVTVTQSYIHLLKANFMYNEAISLINRIGKLGNNAANYLNVELKEIVKLKENKKSDQSS